MTKELPSVDISIKTPLKDILKLSGDCNKCVHCCKYDAGYLIDGDLEKITKFLGINEKELKEKFLDESEKFNTTLLKPKRMKKTKKGEKDKKPFGECVFLDHNEGCTIHEVKPLHCKVGYCDDLGEATHIWFTLNYFVNKNDPESIRQWATYLKTHPTISGGKLEELVPDKKILSKILNYEIFK